MQHVSLDVQDVNASAAFYSNPGSPKSSEGLIGTYPDPHRHQEQSGRKTVAFMKDTALPASRTHTLTKGSIGK